MISRAVAYALGAAVLAMAGLALFLWMQLASARSDLQDCNTRAGKLAGQIELQSAEIAEWRTNADAAFELANELRAAARRQTAAQQKRIDDLNRRIAQPAPEGKTCTDAMQEIRGAMQ